MANSFFKNGDKAYSENLNDSVLVGNAFDWTVSIGLPADNGGVFPNSSTVVKAKVADVYITPNSNLSIGSSIENSSGSSQVYRLTVYPNFNRFGGFKSISLTADSGVTFYIANKGGTTPIANNLDYDNLDDVPELKLLKEYDIVLTIPNGKSVSGLEFVFQSKSADVSSSINQSNISGLNDRLNTIESDISNMIDLIYPVGSIYMSVNSTSPSTLFGGTWEQLQDRFLLGASSTYTAGGTGGEATHSLTKTEMPRHTHTQNGHTHGMAHTHNHHHMMFEGTAWSNGSGNVSAYTKQSNRSAFQGYTEWDSTASSKSNTDSTTATNKYTGGTGSAESESDGVAHNNMPPYLSVYMWKRTA